MTPISTLGPDECLHAKDHEAYKRAINEEQSLPDSQDSQTARTQASRLGRLRKNR